MGNFEKIFKYLLKNCYKCINLAYFSKKLKTIRLFSPVWTKNVNRLEIFEKILKDIEEKSREKLNFIFVFWENL